VTADQLWRDREETERRGRSLTRAKFLIFQGLCEGRPKPRGYVACRGALSEAFMDGALATHLPWSGLQAA